MKISAKGRVYVCIMFVVCVCVYVCGVCVYVCGVCVCIMFVVCVGGALCVYVYSV